MEPTIIGNHNDQDTYLLKPIRPRISSMEHVTEVCCYTGPVLSLVLAWRLAMMDSRSWIHNMLLLYFSADAVCGTAETALLFRLYRGRCERKNMII